MGTNYYWENVPCESCGHVAERIHIGKSSAGWAFGFHGTETIRSYRDWLAKIESGGSIVDEYGKAIAIEDFKRLVEAKLLWNERPSLNLARMATCPESAWNDAEREYWVSNPRDTLFNRFRARSAENWLDSEGHGFSEYEFS